MRVEPTERMMVATMAVLLVKQSIVTMAVHLVAMMVRLKDTLWVVVTEYLMDTHLGSQMVPAMVDWRVQIMVEM